MKYLLIILLLSLGSQNPALAIEQRCIGSDCVQIGKNIGSINIEGRELQIGINQGIVNIIGSPEDQTKIKDYKIKIANLETQINHHLDRVQKQEKRHLNDQEKLHKATTYTFDLLKQIDQLSQRNARIDLQHKLNQRIKAANDRYDVPLIKELLKQKLQLESMQPAETAYQLAGFQELDLEYNEAYKNYNKAVFLQKDNATYLNATGEMALTLANFNNAIHLFEKALASNLKMFGEEHPTVATLRNNLGSAWDSLGDYQKAISYYEQALASVLKTYGEDHPNVATGRNNLGLTWASLGNYQKATSYYEQALASDLKSFGEDHPDVATDRNNLGGVWDSLGEYQKAIGYYEQALASDLKSFGEEHPNVARDRNNLGSAWDSLGDYQKAIGYFKQALASDLKLFGEDHPDVAIDRNNLGLAWASLGDYKKAIGYYEQALKSFEKTLGSSHPSTKTVKDDLQQLRIKMQDQNKE